MQQLLADAVFANAPGGIRYSGTTHSPASWHQGVDGAGWSGANVSARFTTTLPRPTLNHLFDTFVEQAGWKLDRTGNRPPDAEQWTKRLPAGAQVTLDLWPDPTTNAADHFMLSGNVDVPCH